MKIEQLLSGYKTWKEEEPKFDYKTLGDYGSIKIRLSSEEIIITKRGQTSADTDKDLYIPIKTAKEVYLYLKELFEDEK